MNDPRCPHSLANPPDLADTWAVSPVNGMKYDRGWDGYRQGVSLFTQPGPLRSGPAQPRLFLLTSSPIQPELSKQLHVPGTCQVTTLHRQERPPDPSPSAQQRPSPNPSWAGSLGQPLPPVSLEASGILLLKQDAEWCSVSSEVSGFWFLSTKSSLGPLGWLSVGLAEPCRTPHLAAVELVSEHGS